MLYVYLLYFVVVVFINSWSSYYIHSNIIVFHMVFYLFFYVIWRVKHNKRYIIIKKCSNTTSHINTFIIKLNIFITKFWKFHHSPEHLFINFYHIYVRIIWFSI